MADAGTGAGMVAMAAATITVATIQADAATHAADIQVAQAKYSADLIDARFQQMRTDFEPYRAVGVVAVGQLNTRLNEFTSTANVYAAAMDAEMPTLPPELTSDVLELTPGYIFTRDEGIKATTNAMAARGLDGSGAQMKAIATFVCGLAAQTYNTRVQQLYQRFLMQQQRFTNVGQRFAWDQGLLVNAYNRLNSVVTLGQNSAAQVGKAGTDSANQAGAAMQAGASAAAAGILTGANAIGGGINGLANAYNSYQQQGAMGINGGSNSLAGAGETKWASSGGYSVNSNGTYTTNEAGS